MASIAIIGGGPAGLFAADRLAGAGHGVTIYDRMPSPCRKFLMAGRGGLNLTHSEPFERFLARYPDLPEALEKAIRAFPPDALRDFAAELGQRTFIGTSGRVFPEAMKASPMLRAWLSRLEAKGVTLKPATMAGLGRSGRAAFRHACRAGFCDGDATLLALGGASWPRLGSDGGWATLLAAKGVDIAPLVASNVGVLCDWSAKMRERAGEPLKRTDFAIGQRGVIGEAVVTEKGIEGGAIYALSAKIREALAKGPVTLTLDFGLISRPPLCWGDWPRGGRAIVSRTACARGRGFPPCRSACCTRPRSAKERSSRRKARKASHGASRLAPCRSPEWRGWIARFQPRAACGSMH